MLELIKRLSKLISNLIVYTNLGNDNSTVGDLLADVINPSIYVLNAAINTRRLSNSNS